ncbi:hypothetical protein LEP1GSC188_2306 [Leptospira weilii serovar Topaz str. LT2116]|uniref:Uncharacterized protein n=1 Tax=Leptospira weilii serovar Topaz str. LT2116 TaxID=1088540 RepID=M3G6U7_9LEPT|nr:hypothetical protein LEP1GSC188_2306 [Leptospira weilii serovar Topaz str. LT2116]EMJ63166.1 hypothetical protein LEP1GSC051_1167 [Leptospira sp. P2653]
MSSRKKIRKNFLKLEIPTISEFVRKIAICGSSHILRIEAISKILYLFLKGRFDSNHSKIFLR